MAFAIINECGGWRDFELVRRPFAVQFMLEFEQQRKERETLCKLMGEPKGMLINLLWHIL